MELNYNLNEELLQDCINLATGLFFPLKGFMNSSDYHSVVNNMILSDQSVWTIPISLDLPYEIYMKVVATNKLFLSFNAKEVGYVEVDDCFVVDIEKDLIKIFGTDDSKHPGVANELQRYKYRVGGKVIITDKDILKGSLNPNETKKYFKSQGWKTIAGFQTRNPIHKAHEHLQRIALEVCDALFINPLVGWKKIGDFSEEAVIEGYKAMIDEYYTDLNIYFDTLKTPMRYAGPKEAIFHAIIRRNLGCTHFIIGRDHAGVGDYYGKYEAQELAKKIISKYELGIELLLLSEPYYCKKCMQIVSEKTCRHSSENIQKISGTEIRLMLSQGKKPNTLFMRKEVSESIIKLKKRMFIT
ncbi:sulfate adenylyltransferase [Poseidonibacter sp.]|uniref:sulfate adenylyltransferase n=1 Tax=Poseidonibacter sp. TaxID=2321188 RepID=UPI003C737589